MAEFIFDLQRFPDGGAGNSGGSNGGGSNSGSTNSAITKNGVSNNFQNSGYSNTVNKAGWEPRIRREGEIVFPLFMDAVTAAAFAEQAYEVYNTAWLYDLVPHYDAQNNIVDTLDYSRINSGSVMIDNDPFDVINLVDTNVGNVIEYYTYANSDTMGIIFDTGAILEFDLDQVSPLFNFANGESMIYSERLGEWVSGNEAATEYVFWNSAVRQSGTDAEVDNIYVTQNANNAISNVTSDDNILLYDTTSSDVALADYSAYSLLYDTTAAGLDLTSDISDSEITLYFPTGGALVVENDDVFSPNFYFADGVSYYYNRHLDEWRLTSQKAADLVDYEAYQEVVDAQEAAEAAAEKALYEEVFYANGYDYVYEADAIAADGSFTYNFPVTALANTYIYDAGYYDTINLIDAVAANVAGMAVEDNVINIAFNTGKVLTVEYEHNFSPIFQFADTFQIGYDWYTKTWGNAYYSNDGVEENLAISRSNNSLIYQADSSDNIYFTDAVVENVTAAVTGTKYINLYFDTGAVVNVRYTDDVTPEFHFVDGSSYAYDSELETWIASSADAASDGLWGDTTDTVDGLLGDGAIASGATLSDLVSAPVDNAAVSFNADSAFDINAAGGFVAANTAVSSEQKEA